MPTTPRGIWTPADSDDFDIVTDMAATAVSVDDAITAGLAGIPRPWRYSGTEAQRAALTAPDLRNGIEFQTTDSNLVYLRTAGAWRIAPGTLLGSMELTTNVTGAAGALVGTIVSTVALPVGQRVKVSASYSQYNVSAVNSNFTMLQARNSSANVSWTEYDKRAGARGWSSVAGQIHSSVSPWLILTATTAEKVSAGIYIASGTTGVSGADLISLSIEAV